MRTELGKGTLFIAIKVFIPHTRWVRLECVQNNFSLEVLEVHLNTHLFPHPLDLPLPRKAKGSFSLRTRAGLIGPSQIGLFLSKSSHKETCRKMECQRNHWPSAICVATVVLAWDFSVVALLLCGPIRRLDSEGARHRYELGPSDTWDSRTRHGEHVWPALLVYLLCFYPFLW